MHRDMLYFKHQLVEIIDNSKVGLIGSGFMLAITTTYDFVGERGLRIAMLFIGLIVGILTMVKLGFEVYAAVIKFIGRRRMLHEHDERRQERKERESK